MTLPTTNELALIAASLARNGSSPKALAAGALEIWQACQAEIQRKQEPASNGEPLPDNPVTNEQLVLLALPKLKGRTAEAASVYRQYVTAELRRKLKREPNLNEVTKAYAGSRKIVIPPGAVETAKGQFMRWHDIWRKTETSKIRSDSGKRGAAAKKALSRS